MIDLWFWVLVLGMECVFAYWSNNMFDHEIVIISFVFLASMLMWFQNIDDFNIDGCKGEIPILGWTYDEGWTLQTVHTLFHWTWPCRIENIHLMWIPYDYCCAWYSTLTMALQQTFMPEFSLSK